MILANHLTDTNGQFSDDYKVIMDEGTQSWGQMEDVDEPSDGDSFDDGVAISLSDGSRDPPFVDTPAVASAGNEIHQHTDAPFDRCTFRIYRRIAYYLASSDDLIELMCVSKCALPAVAPFIWHNPQFAEYARQLRVSKFIKSLASPRDHLHSLIRKIDFHQVALTDADVDAVTFACTKLHSFGVHSPNISVRAIAQLLRKHPNIRKLDISGCTLVETELLLKTYCPIGPETMNVTTPGSELVELSLANTITKYSDVRKLLTKFPNLKTLDLGKTYITDESFIELAESNLQSLSLSQCSGLTADGLYEFVQSPHVKAKLKHLDISFTQANFGTLLHALEFGVCLKSFHGVDCHNTETQFIPRAVPILSLIHALVLQDSLMTVPQTTTPSGVAVSRINIETLHLGAVEENTLRYIIARCPFLKELQLTGLQGDDSILGLIANMEHLEILLISSSKVTEAGIRTLTNGNAAKSLKQLRTLRQKFDCAFIGEIASCCPKLEYWETLLHKFPIEELISLTFEYLYRADFNDPLPAEISNGPLTVEILNEPVERMPVNHTFEFVGASESLQESDWYSLLQWDPYLAAQLDSYSYPQHFQLPGADPPFQPCQVSTSSGSSTVVPLPLQPLPADSPKDDSIHSLEPMPQNLSDFSLLQFE